MRVKELYDWAKERNLLDKQIAKHFNFNIEDCSGNITFTVKNHSEYNGERQTEVSRCKLVCN